MKYRAKITNIQSWVESNININRWPLVRDAKDVYIEVDSEDEAELLEQINKADQALVYLKNQWYHKFYLIP